MLVANTNKLSSVVFVSEQGYYSQLIITRQSVNCQSSLTNSVHYVFTPYAKIKRHNLEKMPVLLCSQFAVGLWFYPGPHHDRISTLKGN